MNDWSDAITNADENGDLEPLAALLRSGERPPAVVCDWLANLLEQPTYRPPTELELRVLVAEQEYRSYGRKPGETKKNAIKRLAREHHCDLQQLKTYINSAGNGPWVGWRNRLA